MATDPLIPIDPHKARLHREYTGLLHLRDRHAATDRQRRRHLHSTMIGPDEAVRLVVALASGSVQVDKKEPSIDSTDLIAALTLMPKARAEMDAIEASLLMLAKGRGMTWQEIAFGLGLGSAQAARQRYERLADRGSADGTS